MAKAFIKCKEDYKKIVDSMATPASECLKLKTSFDTQVGAISFGCKELCLRIAELKKTGKVGATVEDFAKQDNEALEYLMGVKKILPGFISNNDRYNAAYKSWTQARNEFAALLDFLAKEVVAREKKLFEPKTLPDMKKLQKEAADKFKRISEDWGMYGPIDNAKQKQKIDTLLKDAATKNNIDLGGWETPVKRR